MRIERDAELAILRMEDGKANALSEGFLHRMGELVGELLHSDARAVVVTGTGSIFSAGLALPTLIERDRDGMREFMMLLGTTLQGLYALPLPVVAAINGHAIAGGCIIAMMCDHRVMVDDRGRIGLTEASLGIGLPPIAIEPLLAQVPPTSVAVIAQQGQLLMARVAHELGLVEELVPAEQVLTTATDRARALGEIGPEAYGFIKAARRERVVERMEATREAQLERWLDTWFSETGQRNLRAAVAKLAQKG